MKTYLGNYLFSRQLITSDQCDDLNNIEYFLTTENFRSEAKKAYKIIFGEEPEPIVFTGHKFFLTKKVHPLFARTGLMEKGLHIFRMVFARHAHALRHKGFDEFDNVGLMTFENFLPEDISKKVMQEISDFPMAESLQSMNNERVIEDYEHLSKLVHGWDIFNTCVKAVHRPQFDEAAREHFIQTSYVQRLKNNPNNGDIQKVCHSDVFYPCLKYWYFPEGVTEEEGPFMYAKGSTSVTEEQLDYFYRESVAVCNDTWDRKRNKGHGEGSFRALPEDLQAMNLKLEPVAVKPNTLVIADTSGWHCRGEVTRPSIRNALHGAIRVETPFDA